MTEYATPGKLRRAGRHLQAVPGVRDVTVTENKTGRQQVEVVVGPRFKRVPPRVLRTAAEHDLGFDPDRSGSRGDPRQFVVVFC